MKQIQHLLCASSLPHVLRRWRDVLGRDNILTQLSTSTHFSLEWENTFGNIVFFVHNNTIIFSTIFRTNLSEINVGCTIKLKSDSE